MTKEEAVSFLQGRVKLIDKYYPDVEDYREALVMAVQSLQQEPCEDCIRRSDISLTDFEIVMCNGDYKEALKMLLGKIEKAPPVTPAEKVGQWIPVSERLPEEKYKSYWICTDCGCQCECRWTNVNPLWTDLTTDWHWNHMDVPSYQKVVAWMPLPKPYKAESEDKE